MSVDNNQGLPLQRAPLHVQDDTYMNELFTSFFAEVGNAPGTSTPDAPALSLMDFNAPFVQPEAPANASAIAVVDNLAQQTLPTAPAPASNLTLSGAIPDPQLPAPEQAVLFLVHNFQLHNNLFSKTFLLSKLP